MMMDINWAVTMLAVHVLAAWAFGSVYCTAPDGLQKMLLLVMISSALMLVGVYAIDLAAVCAGAEPRGEAVTVLKHVALWIEHLAVLLWVFRIIHRERLTCRNY